jgi:two-component system, OmpR family, response regulator VicR
MRRRILVVQTSDRMAPVIREAFDNTSFELRCKVGLSDIVATVLELKPSLVLFDIARWEKAIQDSLSELMSLHGSRSSRKIVFADSAEMDEKVSALLSGADDFLLKPISARELFVRVGAVLRSHTTDTVEEDVQTLGTLSLFRESMEICVGSEKKKLSQTEFNLLSYLMDHPGRVFNREELLEKAWVPWKIEDRRVVDVYIHRLREKIEEDPSCPQWLLTRRGQGYFLIDQMRSNH